MSAAAEINWATLRGLVTDERAMYERFLADQQYEIIRMRHEGFIDAMTRVLTTMDTLEKLSAAPCDGHGIGSMTTFRCPGCPLCANGLPHETGECAEALAAHAEAADCHHAEIDQLGDCAGCGLNVTPELAVVQADPAADFAIVPDIAASPPVSLADALKASLARHTEAAAGDRVRNKFTGAIGIVIKADADFLTVAYDADAEVFSGWRSAFEAHTEAACDTIRAASDEAVEPSKCEDCGQFADTRCDNCGLPICTDCTDDRSGVLLCRAECQRQLHPDTITRAAL